MPSLNLRPLGDRVWVEPIERDEMTASGIVLPETAKEKPMEGKILAVGPGTRTEKGDRQALDVKVGDKVVVISASPLFYFSKTHEKLFKNNTDYSDS